jgi:hypothetical protein
MRRMRQQITLDSQPQKGQVACQRVSNWAQMMRQFVLEVAKCVRTNTELTQQRHDPERPTIATESLHYAAVHDPRAKSDRTD